MKRRVEAGLRLRVEVGAAPSPHLLRAAIERRLGGGPAGAGPEDVIAETVARAVRARLEKPEGRPWR